MLRSKKFISMPIISLEEGQQIGSVRGIVVNPFKREIAALIIDQKGWFKNQKIIPYAKVSSVGDDAITVEKVSNAEKATNLPEMLKLLKEDYDLISSKVITESGSILGYVDEFYIDPTNGVIESMEISGRFLDSILKGRATLEMAFTRTIGKEVIVVQDSAMENLIKLDGGLQETFSNFKDSTAQLWETTVQKTKELGKNLKKEIQEDDLPEEPEVPGEPVYQGKFSKPTTIDLPAQTLKPTAPPVDDELLPPDDKPIETKE